MEISSLTMDGLLRNGMKVIEKLTDEEIRADYLQESMQKAPIIKVFVQELNALKKEPQMPGNDSLISILEFKLVTFLTLLNMENEKPDDFDKPSKVSIAKATL